jgi:hypothetical protein
MIARPALAALLLAQISFTGCESYTSPYLDEQGALSEKLRRGEITRAEYEQALAQQREGQAWGGMGGVNEMPRSYHTSF